MTSPRVLGFLLQKGLIHNILETQSYDALGQDF